MDKWLDEHRNQDLIRTAYEFRIKYNLTTETASKLIAMWQKGELK